MILSARRDCAGEDAAFKSFMVTDKMRTDCEKLLAYYFPRQILLIFVTEQSK